MKIRNYLQLCGFTLFALILFFPVFTFTTKAVPLSPDKYYLNVNDVNNVIEEKLTIYGRQEFESIRKINLYVLGMRKIGEENEREFYLPNPTDPTEPANWITLEQSEVYLTPGEDTIVNWTLTPSSRAACGTNLAAIVATPVQIDINSGSEQAISSLKEQIISQVHIDVSKLAIEGECPVFESRLSVIEFKVDKFTPLFNYDSVKLLTRIQNTGNLISKSPLGYITIKGFNVQREEGTINFNEEGLDIYPNSIRRFNNVWLDPNYPRDGNFLEQFKYELTHLRIGRYKAELGITKNVDPDIVLTTTFWVFPWKLMIVIAILLSALLSYLIYKKKTGVKYVKKSKSTFKVGK
jgi:hypothetical protein